MRSAEGGRGPVLPGTGWPGDPATARTPVAADPAEVVELAASAGSLGELVARQSVCRACPRLVAWREKVAVERRRSFADEQYWGRPIPGWGAEHPAVLIAGLAPAAHGGNRTGRIFTGDRSGDWLFASLYRCGLAVQPTSVTADDGQQLIGARMVPAVRCAPPDNKPENSERDACEPWLSAELGFILADLRVIVCLGHYAWQAVWRELGKAGFAVPRPRPAFGHAVEVHAVEVQVDPVQADPVQADPVQADPVQADPVQADPVQADPVQADPVQADPVQADPVQAVEVQADPVPQPRPSSTAGPAPGTGSSGPRPDLLIMGCYHPSQQNTFTGRVTEPMLDAVFTRAASYAGLTSN